MLSHGKETPTTNLFNAPMKTRTGNELRHLYLPIAHVGHRSGLKRQGTKQALAQEGEHRHAHTLILIMKSKARKSAGPVCRRLHHFE